MNSLKIFTDGGARGNPGPAAIGMVIKDEKDKVIWKNGKTIGTATNNQAEYKGLIEALREVRELNLSPETIDCFLDSNLVVQQMKGKFKIKSAGLKTLWKEAKSLELSLKTKINYHHIPREKNSQADSLLNQALDLL